MRKRATTAFIAILMLFFTCALAHPGGLDNNGGHKDKKNASGLGDYHYHCNKTPAHLHDEGVCPYTLEKVEAIIAAKKAATVKATPTSAPQLSLGDASPLPSHEPKVYRPYIEAEEERKQSTVQIIIVVIIAIPITVLIMYIQRKSGHYD